MGGIFSTVGGPGCFGRQHVQHAFANNALLARRLQIEVASTGESGR